MDAGRLRERVTIEGETRVANGQGGWKTGWAAIARNVAAEIVGMSGDEALRLGVERSTTLYRVRIRKRAGVTAANRLVWKGQPMAIRSGPLPDSQDPNSIMVLTAEIGAVGS